MPTLIESRNLRSRIRNYFAVRKVKSPVHAALAVPFLVFLAVYAPSVGLGFISDDFGWIAHSRVTSGHDLLSFFTNAPGFYRPLVSLSFAGDYAVFGMHPLGYGWTNLLLVVLDAVLVARLAATMDTGRAAAGLAAAVWLLNFHGINMALLWISGRSALLLIAGALVSITAVLRGSTAVALLGFAAALLSKEEAVVLPLIGAAAIALRLGRGPRSARVIVLGAAAGVVLGAYGVLRTHAGAMTPATAPSYYQFTFSADALARNVLEYLDRAATFPAAVSLAAFALLWPAGVRVHRSLILFTLVWFVAGFIPTIAIPSRSSLYACFPSIGAALACGHVVESFWDASTRQRRLRALAACVVVPLVCLPMYAMRNHRWTDLAIFSSHVLDDLAVRAPEWPDGSTLVLMDDRTVRVNLNSAFGTLIGDAVSLRTGRDMKVWVEPPPTYALEAGMSPPCAGCPVVRLTVRSGRLREY